MKTIRRVGMGLALGGAVGLLAVIIYLAWTEPSFRIPAFFILAAVLTMSGLFLWSWSETEIAFKNIEPRYKR